MTFFLRTSNQESVLNIHVSLQASCCKVGGGGGSGGGSGGGGCCYELCIYLYIPINTQIEINSTRFEYFLGEHHYYINITFCVILLYHIHGRRTFSNRTNGE